MYIINVFVFLVSKKKTFGEQLLSSDRFDQRGIKMKMCHSVLFFLLTTISK